VLLLHRPAACYESRERAKEAGVDSELAEIIVAKQRNGPRTVVEVDFLEYCTRWEDRL
jgi:replicative DNA helicase